MVLECPGQPLRPVSVAVPRPGAGEVLVKVRACAVCRTDLHVVDGDLRDPKLPLIPGHEIVGEVVELGEGVDRVRPGDRVGIPWLAWTCGHCRFCLRGQENLCERARFTGYTVDGGYAEYALADERYAFPIPDQYDDVSAAPLLCAGLIGYRALRLALETVPTLERLGIYGFGAAGHLVAQFAVADGVEVYAFTREDDTAGQGLALEVGASWAGASTEPPPHPLDAALIFAPVGELVPAALRVIAPGGAVVCGGIHMTDIPSFPYEILWGERVVRSVANLQRRDGEEFLPEAARRNITPRTTPYALEDANRALDDLRGGRVHGAATLVL